MNSMKLSWLPNELDTAGRENLDPEHVANYDRKETIDVASEIELLQRLGLDDTSEVIDIGAGTGQLTLKVASLCHWMTAVDISPVMLERLRQNVRDAELSNVEIVQSGFLRYEHRREPVDFLYSRLVLHHLPDFWKSMALKNARRAMRTGGVLRLCDVVYNFDLQEAEGKLNDWCEMFSYDEPEGSWNRADIEEHIRDEHSTFTWILEPIIERCGFRIEEAEYPLDGIFAEYVARAV